MPQPTHSLPTPLVGVERPFNWIPEKVRNTHMKLYMLVCVLGQNKRNDHYAIVQLYCTAVLQHRVTEWFAVAHASQQSGGSKDAQKTRFCPYGKLLHSTSEGQLLNEDACYNNPHGPPESQLEIFLSSASQEHQETLNFTRPALVLDALSGVTMVVALPWLVWSWWLPPSCTRNCS